MDKSYHKKNPTKGMILFFVCMAAGTIFAVSGTAFAATSPQQELVGTLDNVRNLLIAVGTVVAAIGYVITAYMWMLSNGNPEQRYRARKYFVDVTFGIFLLFASSFLVALAQSLVA